MPTVTKLYLANEQTREIIEWWYDKHMLAYMPNKDSRAYYECPKMSTGEMVKLLRISCADTFDARVPCSYKEWNAGSLYGMGSLYEIIVSEGIDRLCGGDAAWSKAEAAKGGD